MLKNLGSLRLGIFHFPAMLKTGKTKGNCEKGPDEGGTRGNPFNTEPWLQALKISLWETRLLEMTENG